MKLFSPAQALAALSLLSTHIAPPFTQALTLDPGSQGNDQPCPINAMHMDMLLMHACSLYQ